MFETILIANRGEIALRAIRTCRRLGIRAAVVHSDDERAAEHVRQADLAYSLGSGAVERTYMDAAKILDGARACRVQAIFPGYGFLSEDAAFAAACERAGFAFVGPTPSQLERLGPKLAARRLAEREGVPTIPGSGLLRDLGDALEAAERIGYPVMLKESAGGGGAGIVSCKDRHELSEAFRRHPSLAGGSGARRDLFLERRLEGIRHVEVQILGDGAGTVSALGDRECSLQRRHQKIVEESPAPGIPRKLRSDLADAAARIGRAVSYRSAGSIEFLCRPASGEFRFLEANPRLQVEHTVTESVFGIDLVECMLRVAAGEDPGWKALRTVPVGVSIEARICAEDPHRDFQPSTGIVSGVAFPEDVRVDGWVVEGTRVSGRYDSLLAKVVVHGSDREEASLSLRRALARCRIDGIRTNLGFLRELAASPGFQAGTTDTEFLESIRPTAPALEILDPGLSTTIQDLPGRTGLWNVGIPPSGPMDDYSFRIANRLVGNRTDAPGIEATLEGPSILFHGDAVFALAGAELDAFLDGDPVPSWKAVRARAGQILSTRGFRKGCRAYIALRGGVECPPFLGSRSTFAPGGFGGPNGGALREGELLDLGAHADPGLEPCFEGCSRDAVPDLSRIHRIGVLVGPHGTEEFLPSHSLEGFFDADWEVLHDSNRLGLRLAGPEPIWARLDGGEAGMHPSNIHDSVYSVGSINFAGNHPVILGVDGPSLGGFACPATIASAESWKVGQLRPGDKIRFAPLDAPQALEAKRLQDRATSSLRGPLPDPVASPSSLRSGGVLAEMPAKGDSPRMVLRQAGDSRILVEYGEDVLDLSLRMRVHLLESALSVSGAPLEELSPGVRSLQIRFDPDKIRQDELVDRVVDANSRLPSPSTVRIPSRVVHLPIAFDDAATTEAVARYQATLRPQAPWLPSNAEFLRRANGFDGIEDLRDTILAATYLVLGLGDVYLGSPCAVPLDPRHRLFGTKYDPARTFTPEGAVGIGGSYLCIYGMDSPGGYQLVGRTLPIWSRFATNRRFLEHPWLLRPFDQIRFHRVEENRLEIERGRFKDGLSDIRIEETVFDFDAYSGWLESESESIGAARDLRRAAFEAELAGWSERLPDAPPVLHRPTELSTGDLARTETGGTVWKILAIPGQAVESGQILAILESMKTEIRLAAKRAGTIAEVLATPGSVLSAGDPLFRFAPDPAPVREDAEPGSPKEAAG